MKSCGEKTSQLGAKNHEGVTPLFYCLENKSGECKTGFTSTNSKAFERTKIRMQIDEGEEHIER